MRELDCVQFFRYVPMSPFQPGEVITLSGLDGLVQKYNIVKLKPSPFVAAMESMGVAWADMHVSNEGDDE
jgi:hypothetical protein